MGLLFFTLIYIVFPISKLKFQTLPEFYKDLIKVWISISQSDVTDVQDILSQSIWDNKQITIQKQPIFDKYLANKNVNLVADLVKNGRSKTWEGAKRDFGLPQGLFLKWFGILEAIPKSFRKHIKNSVLTQQQVDELKIDRKLLIKSERVDLNSLNGNKIL